MSELWEQCGNAAKLLVRSQGQWQEQWVISKLSIWYLAFLMIATCMKYILCVKPLAIKDLFLLVQSNNKVVHDFAWPSSLSILATKEDSP